MPFHSARAVWQHAQETATSGDGIDLDRLHVWQCPFQQNGWDQDLSDLCTLASVTSRIGPAPTARAATSQPLQRRTRRSSLIHQTCTRPRPAIKLGSAGAPRAGGGGWFGGPPPPPPGVFWEKKRNSCRAPSRIWQSVVAPPLPSQRIAYWLIPAQAHPGTPEPACLAAIGLASRADW